MKTHHDLPSSINVGVEQSKDVLERNVGLGRSENGRPIEIEREQREGMIVRKSQAREACMGDHPDERGSDGATSRWRSCVMIGNGNG